MIDAGVSELRQAFHAHRRVAGSGGASSSYLLLFYAVECGLKAVWLKRHNLWTTAQMRDKTLLSRNGHDLRRWSKELKLPARLTQSPTSPVQFRLTSDNSAWDVGDAHQAWRYGVRMDPDDEQALVAWLGRLGAWLHEELQR